MPNRRRLSHEIPGWVDESSQIWFITICCLHRGGNQLTNQETGTSLLSSIAYRQDSHLWYAHLFLLMPDHCHALLSFNYETSGLQTIRNWKRRTSRELKIAWQPDFFEHRLRSEESFDEKADYIRQNPVRAGLVENSADWPYIFQAGG